MLSQHFHGFFQRSHGGTAKVGIPDPQLGAVVIHKRFLMRCDLLSIFGAQIRPFLIDALHLFHPEGDPGLQPFDGLRIGRPGLVQCSRSFSVYLHVPGAQYHRL